MPGGKGVVVELTGELDLEQRAPGWGRRGPWGRARFLTEASVTTGTGRDWGNFCSPLVWLSDEHKAGGVEGVFGAVVLGAETASPDPPRTQKTREEKGLGEVVTGGAQYWKPRPWKLLPLPGAKLVIQEGGGHLSRLQRPGLRACSSDLAR